MPPVAPNALSTTAGWSTLNPQNPRSRCIGTHAPRIRKADRFSLGRLWFFGVSFVQLVPKFDGHGDFAPEEVLELGRKNVLARVGVVNGVPHEPLGSICERFDDADGAALHVIHLCSVCL